MFCIVIRKRRKLHITFFEKFFEGENMSSGKTFNYAPQTAANSPLSKYNVGDSVTKTVRTVNCIYCNEGFQVYQVELVDKEGYFISIVGTFPYRLSLNAYYNVSGEVAVDKRGEKQIKISSCESTFPTDYNGIITVLKTLHGLDTQAHKLYEEIGPNVLELLKTDPEQVAARVKGIGKKRAKEWQLELLSRGENDREIRKLYELGLSPRQATRLVADYGIGVCDEVARNPYRLIDLLSGYTFKKCDSLALGSGTMDINNPDRIKAGIMYALTAFERKGNCAAVVNDFMDEVHSTLDFSVNSREAYGLLKSQKQGLVIPIKWGRKTYQISVDDLNTSLQEWEIAHRDNGDSSPFRYIIEPISEKHITSSLFELKTGNHIVFDTQDGVEYVMTSAYYTAEKDIASSVRDFVANERMPFKAVQKALDDVLTQEKVVLEKNQREAVLRICEAHGGIFVLNGSAGCGKTFTLNILIKVLRMLYRNENKELDPCVLAPTGKAAKVASKATGLPTYTIHRALGLIADDTLTNTQQSLLNNCVVVDEFSMVDTLLCSLLFGGIQKTAKVILLGDTAQLPSVRPGKVLRDIIDSHAVPVLTLTVVKRQENGSGVLENAKKIVAGENIETNITRKNGLKGNAYIIREFTAFSAQQRIINTVKTFGLRAFQNGTVQVLCPIKAGAVGITVLNYLIQKELNPQVSPDRDVVYGKITIPNRDGSEETYPAVFRVGDVVIHTKNNYNQPWFRKHPVNGYIESSGSGVVNGDTGVIEDVKFFKDGNKVGHRVLYVKYDHHYIAYDNDFDELMLAYAMTIHKSQGSQWPVVICPIVQRITLLNRKLVYTMYTRAQDTNILIGNPDYINAAIQNDYEDKRCTLLLSRLTNKKD